MKLGKTICKIRCKEVGDKASKNGSKQLGKKYIKVFRNMARKYAKSSKDQRKKLSNKSSG